jgi:hypothetical protein
LAFDNKTSFLLLLRQLGFTKAEKKKARVKKKKYYSQTDNLLLPILKSSSAGKWSYISCSSLPSSPILK